MSRSLALVRFLLESFHVVSRRPLHHRAGVKARIRVMRFRWKFAFVLFSSWVLQLGVDWG